MKKRFISLVLAAALAAAFVGYGEDGFTPNEFDITELLHDGEKDRKSVV